MTLPTLKKRLKERGLLASTQTYGNRERLEVRRALEGNRRPVLHLKSSTLVVPEVYQVHHVHQSRSNSKPGPLNSDAINGAVLPVGFKEVYQESEPQPQVDAPESKDNGAIGALGALSEGIDPDSSKLIANQANQTTDPWDSFLKETAE